MKKKIFSTLLLVAFALASTSMFVSCKDYDDDINKNAKAIEELRATIKDLEGKLNDCKSTCAAAHATFATKGELEALQQEIAALVTQQKLEEAIAAAKQTLQDAIDAKASQEDLDALRTLVDGIDSKIAEHLKDYAKTSDVEAVQSDLDRQKEIIALYLGELKKQLGVTDDQAAIDKLIELMNNAKAAMSKVGSFPADDLSQDEINQLRKIMEDYNKEINDNGFVNLNTLQKFLDKMVGSLVLKSDFRVLGVQAIEVPALVLQPTLRLVDPKNPATMELTQNETWNYIHRNAATGEEYLAGAYDADAPIWVEFDPSTSYSTVRKDPWGFFMNYVNDKKKDYVFYNNFEVPAKATYHVNPSTANIDGAKLSFYTNTEFLVEEIESRDTRFEEGQSDFAIASPSVVDKTANVVKDGLLSVNVTLKNWKEYVKFLVQNADGNYIKNKWDIQGYGLNGSEEFSTLTDSINFIALQLQKGDTTVTSGYAAVVPALYHITNLADNAPEVAMPSYLDCGSKIGWSGKNGKGAHMYKTAMDAIAHPATHTVPFDGSIDLAEFVETHYTYLGAKAAWYTYDHTMTQEIFDQLGLKYHYEVISYYPTTGANQTDQKEHIQNYASAPSVFYPRSVVYETGKMIPDQVAKEGAIGKEPLIRVTLENAAGDVFEIGYIKLKITGKEVVETVDMTVLDDVYINCDKNDARLFWHQIESKINDDLHISKANFEAEYEVDGILNYGGKSGKDDLFSRFWVLDNKYVTVADYIAELNRQLAKGDITKGEYDKLVAKATVGDVFNTVSDVREKQNNVIYWWFYKDADYRGLKLAAGISAKSKGVSTEDVVAYVRFKNKVTSDCYIYVKVTIPAGKLHMAFGEIANKDEGQWHKNWSWEYCTGQADADEVHMTVPAPQQDKKVPLTNNDFYKDLNTYFVGATPHVAGMNYEHFSEFENADVTYTFTAPEDANAQGYWEVYGSNRIDGKNVKYLLHVDNFGTEIVAAARYEWNKALNKYIEYPISERVVYIDNAADNTIYSTVHYDYTNAALDILNYVGCYNQDGDYLGKDDTWYMGQNRTFTAYVEINIGKCYDVMLTNNRFRIRFVRPINLIGAEKEMYSHLNDLQVINVKDLVKIRDYRRYLANNLAEYKDDYNKPENGRVGQAYYGITALNVDPNYVFTDHADVSKPKYKSSDWEKIEALHPYTMIPDLFKTDSNGNTPLDFSKANNGLNGVIEYNVKSSTTGEFHIYVPITITYAFGTKTQMVYGIITVKSSVSSEAKKN